MGSEVLAVAERVVTDDQVERAGVAAEGLEGKGCASRVAFASADGGGLLADLVFHGRLFHAPEAELTPAGHGHFLDESVFDGGFGPEFFFEFGENFEEAAATFALEDDGFGKEAVCYRVA